MASRRKTKTTELTAQADPHAPLDSAAFLAATRPVLALLKTDLHDRSEASPAVRAALATTHARERDAGRTGDSFAEWRGHFIEQVAAAWLLSCVFVRTLEDRNLLGHPRIAGPGAQDSQRLFFELAPSLTERDYLLTVFRELSRFPATRALFDGAHNPVWLLAPSADAAKALLALFRAPSADAPAFRFGQPDTRFLGDLYQDLDEAVRKRFALLQTPGFVESYILDGTLEPAIARFGLDDTTLIDPTCGSGHFLLGAFERLYEHRRRQEPDTSEREAVRKALDAVSGADINPFAVAIARLRLTLAALQKAGFSRLAGAPALPLHLVVADSLLYNPQAKQLDLAHQEGQELEAWHGHLYRLEDPKAAREVLQRQYAAVVGNPPYITCKDPVLREKYRVAYASAAGKYSLAAPFTERFFQLGKKGAFVGMITANSFMKREFGKKLIEEVLPGWNLTRVENTSGAYIPGHGTPTVLLFGTTEAPQATTVHAILANRGEPSTPEEPARGLVWRSIVDHGDEVGFDNEYITVAEIDRDTLAKHPWSLGGGGASELKELLEERAEKTLADIADSVGISCVTGEDDVYVLPAEAARRLRVGRTVPLVTGEFVRDWALASAGECVFPFSEDFTLLAPDKLTSELRYLWRYRALISRRKRFGVPMLVRGLSWYELQELYSNKLRTPLSITFAFVATHNHFVLDRGGKVFNRSAPIIKLPEGATEDDHLALLAYLNSSTACFWMKQVMMNKGGSGIGRGIQDEGWESRFEFDGTKLATIPIPNGLTRLVPLASEMLALASERAALAPSALFERRLDARHDGDQGSAAQAQAQEGIVLRRMVALQERIDFEVYALFGLAAIPEAQPSAIEPGHRWFEQQLARERPGTAWFARQGYSMPSPSEGQRPPVSLPPEVQLVEQPSYKRRWGITDWPGAVDAARREAVLGLAEEACRARGTCESVRGLERTFLADASRSSILPVADPGVALRASIQDDAVPFLAAYRFTDAGLEKHAEWQDTWELQRREDAGEKVGEMPVPPKYDQKDYRDATCWRLRGKLDVPKERFISYPGCESDEDKEPVYGWAGWNHLEQAQALAALYNDRKDCEGWTKERLLPMLAGILELLPWIKQWHNEPNAEFDGLRLGDYFEGFLQGQMRELGLTEDDLRAFRPAKRASSRTKKSTRKAEAP